MKRFPRAQAGLILIGVVVAILASSSYAGPPSERCILIEAGFADREEGNALREMGLDIWEFHPNDFVIRVTEAELAEVRNRGYDVQVITEDVYTYLETLRRERVSAFAGAPMTYRSYAAVVAGLQELEVSGVAQASVIGRTHEGRDIWAIKISDHPQEEEGEPGALFLGCHHAREWISVEVPLYIAQHLANNYLADPAIQHLVDNCEIWIVPVVNPDGYEYSRTRDRLWRKNRRNNGNGTFGVDLNRNYDCMWSMAGGASSNTSAEDYRGPSAFSEPETQAVRDLVRAHDLQILMSYHSYGQMTYSPWGYTVELCPDDDPMSAMAFQMRELIRATTGATYIHWTEWPEQYLVSGDTGDWSYGELGVYSFGIELRPITASQGGFVLPESQIEPTCAENLPVALYLTALSAAEGGIANLDTGRTYGSLQFAVNDANDGAEIVLDPGVCDESVYFLGKRLTLRSTDPNDPNVAAATVVHGYHRGAAVTTAGAGEAPCILAGLTIRGEAVGVSCGAAAPVIRNCTIDSNGPSALDFWEGYEPIIVDCNVLGAVTEVYPGIVAYWRLDETEGLIAHDSAGQNDATVIGAPLWQPEGGKVGGALQLSGTMNFATAKYLRNPAEGPLSVFAWVKGGGPGQVIVSQQSGANWLMAAAPDGALATELREPGRNGKPLVSATVVMDGDWHRVGLVWEGTTRILYVDDVEVARDTQTGLTPSVGSLYLGAGSKLGTATFWSGLLDDIRVYNRAVQP